MAEPSLSPAGQAPLAGRRVTEVLATSTGGVGTHVRSILAPLQAAGAAVQVCGPAATDELFGFTATGATFAPGRDLGGAGAGRRRARRGRRSAGRWRPPTSCTPTGCAPDWSRRWPAGSARAPRPWCSRCTTPCPRGAACAAASCAALERAAIRGADVVLAASGDLADNARAAGRPRRPDGPGLGAAAAAGAPHARGGARRARPGRRAGRSSSPSAACIRRRATSPPRRGRPLGRRRRAAPAGRHRRRRAAARSAGRPDRRRAPAGDRCWAAATTSPTCSPPPTCASCPPAGRPGP